RRDQPAGQCRPRLRRPGMTEKEAHDAALACPQSQPAAGGEVEFLRRATDLGDCRGKASAAQPLLENPERLSRPADPDDDQLSRIEAETIEADTIGKARLANAGCFDHPEDRPAVLSGE